MPRIFTEAEIIQAMQAAERSHPPPERHALSKPVSQIAGCFGEMVYMHAHEIEVQDGPVLDLIEQFLAPSA